MSSASVAFENKACQVSLGIELLVGHTRSMSTSPAAHPSESVSSVGHKNVSCC